MPGKYEPDINCKYCDGTGKVTRKLYQNRPPGQPKLLVRNCICTYVGSEFAEVFQESINDLARDVGVQLE